MGVSATVKDGEIVQSTSANSLNSAINKNSASSVNKDDFLQLLVAQMQYQDPLEPTENTQWVSQYAQFSQVEEMQNMSTSMQLSRASALVGQTVIMDVTDGSGNTQSVQGNVDYVSYESGKAFLSINGELYSMDDLKLVVDDQYLEAIDTVTALVEAISKLPELAKLTADDEKSIADIAKSYDDMSDYQKNFVDNKYVTTIKQYVERMAEILNNKE